jgi:hypothetical protein
VQTRWSFAVGYNTLVRTPERASGIQKNTHGIQVFAYLQITLQQLWYRSVLLACCNSETTVCPSELRSISIRRRPF